MAEKAKCAACGQAEDERVGDPMIRLTASLWAGAASFEFVPPAVPTDPLVIHGDCLLEAGFAALQGWLGDLPEKLVDARKANDVQRVERKRAEKAAEEEEAEAVRRITTAAEAERAERERVAALLERAVGG